MRTPAELLTSGLAVIEEAMRTPAAYEQYMGKNLPRKLVEKYPQMIAPLLSGGHDSICACHVASRTPYFTGEVHHIDTGIGSRATRQHVDATCEELGWRLVVHKSTETYEKFIRERGFPGPGMHQWAYIRLKERCVRQIVKGKRVALITGCRSQESVRRMGHVEKIKIGDHNTRKGQPVIENRNRYWVAPCHDWSSEEQAAYMEEHDLPKNPVKLALGMSGECFCGAFASPGELERIRHHCPDVAAEIDRLAGVARECGKHDKWGTRPAGEKGIVVAVTGPMCSSCDLRADAAGIRFADPTCPLPSPTVGVPKGAA